MHLRGMEINLQGVKAENKGFMGDEARLGGRSLTTQGLLDCVKVM